MKRPVRPEPEEFVLVALLGLFAAFVLGAALVNSCGCAASTRYPSAPGVTVQWIGKTAERPWPGLEQALDAADQLISEAYPTHPELRGYVVRVWGANDWMVSSTCIDSGAQKFNGCTNTSLSYPGADYSYFVDVRQIRTSTSGPLHALVFSGPLVDASDSALFWEIADRMIPARLGLPGGHDRPEWVQLRNRMHNRAIDLRKAAR